MLRDQRAIEVVRLVAEFMATSSVESAVALEEYMRTVNVVSGPFANCPQDERENKLYDVYLCGDFRAFTDGYNKIKRIKDIRVQFDTNLAETKSAIEGYGRLYLVRQQSRASAEAIKDDLVDRGYSVVVEESK